MQVTEEVLNVQYFDYLMKMQQFVKTLTDLPEMQKSVAHVSVTKLFTPKYINLISFQMDENAEEKY